MPDAIAAVYDGIPHTHSLETFALPNPSGREVIVRILGCTLCGSDLHSFSGRRTVHVPTVLGHEIVGIIESFGPDHPRTDWSGSPLSVGDRVSWAIVAACGQCYFCTHDLWPKCTRATKYGHERLAPGRELLGGLASHALLVENTAVVKLPNQLSLEAACPANCATATVAAAFEAAGHLSGANVGILGCGLLGLTASAMANDRGAKAVFAMDRSEERRSLAHRFGAAHAIEPEQFAQAVQSKTNDLGLDLLFEFTGSTAALESAWPTVRVGGTIVLVGAVFPDRALSIVPEQIIRRHLTIRGVHNYSPRHLVEAIRFLAESSLRFPFDELVNRWIPLDQVGDAFRLAEDPRQIRIGVRS